MPVQGPLGLGLLSETSSEDSGPSPRRPSPPLDPDLRHEGTSALLSGLRPPFPPRCLLSLQICPSGMPLGKSYPCLLLTLVPQ